MAHKRSVRREADLVGRAARRIARLEADLLEARRERDELAAALAREQALGRDLAGRLAECREAAADLRFALDLLTGGDDGR